MWTSVEVYSYYTECGGLVLSRQGLMAKMANEFRKDIVVLSSPGLASTLVPIYSEYQYTRDTCCWYSEVMPR